MATAPNSTNYRVGGSRIYIKQKCLDGYLDLGNIVNPSVNSTTQLLEHFTSRRGVRVKDRVEITQQQYDIQFSLDELNVQNLNLVFRGGAITDFIQTAGSVSAGSESVQLVADKGVKLANKKISNVVVKSGSTTFVEGVDYHLDADIGLITGLSCGGALYGGGDVTVDYDYADITGKQFDVGKQVGQIDLDGVIFVFVDTGGAIDSWESNKATLSVSGNLGISGTDWSSVQFTLSVLDDGTTENPFGTYAMFNENCVAGGQCE